MFYADYAEKGQSDSLRNHQIQKTAEFQTNYSKLVRG